MIKNMVRTYCISLLMAGAIRMSGYASNDALVIEDGEKLEYRVVTESGKIIETRTTYKIIRNGDEITYAYAHEDEETSWDVRTDSHAEPHRIIHKKGENTIELIFDHEGNVRLGGIWDRRKVEGRKKFLPNVTLENAMIVRTLDFSSGEKYEFDLLQADQFPCLVAYRMFFQVMGEETVTVAERSFPCKKILFTLSDWRSFFYKAYYYVSDDGHRYIVKIDNVPKGGSSELIRIFGGP